MYIFNDLTCREGAANAVRMARKIATYVRGSGVRSTTNAIIKSAYHHGYCVTGKHALLCF